MAASKRAELTSSVEDRNFESLGKCVDELLVGKCLVDTLSELSTRNLNDLWDGLLQMSISILSKEDRDTTSNELQIALQCTTSLAQATLDSIQKWTEDENTQDTDKVPSSLFETAVILHGMLPSIDNEMSRIKNNMSKLFESWWTLGLPGKEQLMTNTIVYLMTRSISANSLKADVIRVWKAHKILPLINLKSESSQWLASLLLEATCCPNFLSLSEGVKYLAYLFTLDTELIENLHQSIKKALPTATSSQLSKYGEIYFTAWLRSKDEEKTKIEQYCIQDLMFRAVHAIRSPGHSMFAKLFIVLRNIHKHKSQRNVEDMLARLYGPILWRSLHVANGDVRANAATLLFDVFPLLDNSLQMEQTDTLLQKHFDAIQNLLFDPIPAVRTISVKGVGQVLDLHWELIPVDVKQNLLSTLLQELVYDASSPAVREAVIKTMQKLCDNHLCIPMLEKALPQLKNFIHDVNEKVRIAMLNLLVVVKGLRAIKFTHIVSIEDILSRLAQDSRPVQKLVMKLIHPSFVPLNLPEEEQANRCAALIEGNPAAARRFFINLPQHLDPMSVAGYIKTLCKAVLEETSKYSPDDGDNDENQSEISGSKKARTNATPARTENETDRVSEDIDMDMVAGMVEGIHLMYFTIYPKLREENPAANEGLQKKLSIMIRKLISSFDDNRLYSALISLSGYIPKRAFPLFPQSLKNRLKQKAQARATDDVMASIIIALVKWGEIDDVLEFIQNSFDKIQEEPPKDKTKKPKTKKKAVGFVTEEVYLPADSALSLLSHILSQPECPPILLQHYTKNLDLILNSLNSAVKDLDDYFSGNQIPEAKSSDLIRMHAMILRLNMFLLSSKEGKRYSENISQLIDNVVLRVSKPLDLSEKSLHDFIDVLINILKSCHSVLKIGMHDLNFIEKTVELLRIVFSLPVPDFTQAITLSLMCVLELTQIRISPDQDQDAESLSSNHLKMISSCLNSFLEAIDSLFKRDNPNQTDEMIESNVSSFLSSVCPVLTKILQQFSTLSDEDEVEQYTKHVVRSIVSTVLSETQNYSRQEKLDKEVHLPDICLTLITPLVKVSTCSRLVPMEISQKVKEENRDLFFLDSVVRLVLHCKSICKASPDLNLASDLNSCLSVVQPGDLDQDVFQSFLEEVKERLQPLLG